MDYDDEKEKLSWSEIDKLKNRSRHVSREKPAYKQSKRSQWAKHQYLKEAEKLFKGKKGKPEYKKARNELHNRHSTPKFNATAKNFIKEYGLPEDWDTLFLLLDYKEAAQVKEVIKKLNDLYPEKSLTEMQGFRAKLEIMAMTVRDKKLKETIRDVLDEI